MKHSRTIILFAILMTILPFSGCEKAPTSSNVVEKFISAIVEKKLDQAMGYIDPQYEKIYKVTKQFLPIDQLFPNIFPLIDTGIKILSQTIVSEEIMDNTSIVKVEWMVDFIDSEGKSNMQVLQADFHLNKFSVGWRIIDIKSDGSLNPASFAELAFPVEGTGWYNCIGSPAHTSTGGYTYNNQGSDDTYALDLNLKPEDKGIAVYPIEDGKIVLSVENWGYILIEHSARPLKLSDGEIIPVWYSGYMHMTEIHTKNPPESSVTKTRVPANLLGNISNINRSKEVKNNLDPSKIDRVFNPAMISHLHFIIYKLDKATKKLVSIDPLRITGFSENYISTNAC